MDSIFTGDLASRRGRAVAWADSLLVDHGLIRLGWSNAAAVIPGRLYRSNHPSPHRLAAQTKNLGLRSVVSLRGPTGNGSDALLREAAAAARPAGVRRAARQRPTAQPRAPAAPA